MIVEGIGNVFSWVGDIIGDIEVGFLMLLLLKEVIEQLQIIIQIILQTI